MKSARRQKKKVGKKKISCGVMGKNTSKEVIQPVTLVVGDAAFRNI